MLHLHGLDHRDLLAFADEVAVRDVERDDRSLQRSGHGDGPFGPRERCRPGVARVRLGRVEKEAAMLPGAAWSKSGRKRIDEARVDPVGDEVRVRDERRKEGQVRLDAGDSEFGERAREPRGGGGEIGPRARQPWR